MLSCLRTHGLKGNITTYKVNILINRRRKYTELESAKVFRTRMEATQAGRPRSSSFESIASSNSKKTPDYGSFTITHTDVPSQEKPPSRRRSKSVGSIKDPVHSLEDKNAFAKILKAKLSRSADSISSKSWSSSDCDMVIYEEDEEGET